MQLFDDNWVARPTRRITFDNNINLILMNVLWKTFCKARHSDLPVCALQESALISFIHDLQVSQVLYPKDYTPILKNLQVPFTLKSLSPFTLVDLCI